MTAKEFSFVLARGLAVFILFTATRELGAFVYQFAAYGDMARYSGDGGQTYTKFLVVALAKIGLLALLAWQLWLRADSFGGVSRPQRAVDGGLDWSQASRLMFTALGILLMVWGLQPILSILLVGERNANIPPIQTAMTWQAGSSIQFVVGLVMLIVSRSTRPPSLRDVANWPRSVEDEE